LPNDHQNGRALKRRSVRSSSFNGGVEVRNRTPNDLLNAFQMKYKNSQPEVKIGRAQNKEGQVGSSCCVTFRAVWKLVVDNGSRKRYLVTRPASFLGPVRKSDVIHRGVIFLEYFGRPKFKAPDWSSTVILVQHAPYYSD